ncbi:MAG: cytochrome C [Porticoccaceae bacterium]|nr:MAG: cytochrome C [Porticoccaceae bacterium]
MKKLIGTTMKVAMAVTLITVGGHVLAAGDAAAGKAKAVTCAGCHGAVGISGNDLWPNLAGQKAGYLAKQIKAFRDGQRNDPMMSSMVKTLSDQDAENLAAYYAGMK